MKMLKEGRKTSHKRMRLLHDYSSFHASYSIEFVSGMCLGCAYWIIVSGPLLSGSLSHFQEQIYISQGWWQKRRRGLEVNATLRGPD
jgi:hypothetical protein